MDHRPRRSPTWFRVVSIVLLLWAMRRGVPPGELVVLGGLALVGAFVVFNKVGSPQFMLWLAAVIAVGVAHDARRWRLPAATMLLIAALTTVVYPMGYRLLYDEHNVWIAAALSARNLLVVVVFIWAVGEIIRRARSAAPGDARPVSP